MERPLEGITVVDMSQVTSGPLAAMVLAEQGADVIKVEPPGIGDFIRRNALQRGGMSSWYLNHNRGKRSIAVSAESAEGRGIIADLMARADVVVENFRPGVMERLGLDYATISRRNPGIVYASISGYGPTGPYADRPVFDPVLQSLVGMVAVQQSEAIPIPDLIRNAVIDKATALFVAQAVCAALFHRERTGKGNHLEVPMLDTGLYFFWPDGMMHRTFLGDDAPEGQTLAGSYQITYCADGQLIYYAATEAQRQALLRLLGHEDLCGDERFMVPKVSEKENWAALGKIFTEGFASRSVAEILPALHAASIPAAPVYELDDVLADPQVQHNEAIVTWEHPHGGRVRQARHPIRFSSAPTPIPEAADLLGEHTDDILAELGRTPEQITALREAGTVE